MTNYRKLIRADIKNVLKENELKNAKEEGRYISFFVQPSPGHWTGLDVHLEEWRVGGIPEVLADQIGNFLNQYFIGMQKLEFRHYQSLYHFDAVHGPEIKRTIRRAIEEAVKRSGPEFTVKYEEKPAGDGVEYNFSFVKTDQ